MLEAISIRHYYKANIKQLWLAYASISAYTLNVYESDENINYNRAIWMHTANVDKGLKESSFIL